jgi:ATP-dependent DNA helicase RecG
VVDDAELALLASDLESDRVERKASLSDGSDRVGQAICAFANDMPGRGEVGLVLVGVTDSGDPSGLTITDRLLQTLAAFRSDGNILPLPTMTVEKRRLRGAEIAVVVVTPSGDPPVRYRGTVWIRVGPRRGIASRDDERILMERRRHRTSTFDEREAGDVTFEDLDMDMFRRQYLPAAVSEETLAQNNRTDEDQLRALHLATPDGRPNVAAILLLGLDPRAFLPGAFVQFARFDGTELDAPILDQKELGGPLADVLRRADELTAVNIRVATAVVGHTQESRSPDYPATALQQVLRNAVLHRAYELNVPVSWYWFSDRVEVHSPGGLYGRVNEANFGEPYATDYRNPVLAEGLKVLGFVQHFGMGVTLTRRACHTNGNPPPEFTFAPSGVLCTIRAKA